jgi:hypothetical protein
VNRDWFFLVVLVVAVGIVILIGILYAELKGKPIETASQLKPPPVKQVPLQKPPEKLSPEQKHLQQNKQQQKPPKPTQPAGPPPPALGPMEKFKVKPIKDFPKMPDFRDILKPEYSKGILIIEEGEGGEPPTAYLKDQSILVIEGELQYTGNPLEFLFSTPGGKGYESLVIVRTKPSTIDLALGLITNFKSGPPPAPADLGKIDEKKQGKRVLIFIQFETKDKKTVTYRAEDLIINVDRKQTMARVGWVYVGTKYIKEPAPEGEPKEIPIVDRLMSMGCIDFTYEEFNSALLHNPLPDIGNRHFYYENRVLIPQHGWPCKLIFRVATKKELSEIEKIEGEYIKKSSK